MKVRWLSIALLSVPLAGLLGVLFTSRFYWGHWLAPPAASDTAAQMNSLSHFTSFRSGSEPACGLGALEQAARYSNDIPGEDPTGRLPAAMVCRELAPESAECLPASLLEAITSALHWEGQLRQGEAAYPNATELRGHVATGISPAGGPVILAALVGGEVSNDRYPYYEVVLTPTSTRRLQLLRLRFYSFDVAGLEGLAHWLAGVAVAVATCVVWVFVGVFVLATKRVHKRVQFAA